MKKSIAILLLALVIIVLLLSGCGGGNAAETDKLKADLVVAQADASRLADENATLRTEKDTAIADKDTALAEAKKLKKDVSDIEDERDDALAKAKTSDDKVASLEAEIEKLQDSVSALPEKYANSAVVDSYEVSSYQLNMRGEVTAVDIANRIVTLLRDGDSLGIYIRIDAFSGDNGKQFQIQELIIGEKVTIMTFYSTATKTAEAVVVYRGNNPMNQW